MWELRFISKHFARAALLQELTAVRGTKGLRPLCRAFPPLSLEPETEETARSQRMLLRPARPAGPSACLSVSAAKPVAPRDCGGVFFF